jgi:hypothetical protein
MTISLVAALFHFILPNRYSSMEIFRGATVKKRRLSHLIVGVSRPNTHKITHNYTEPHARGTTILNEGTTRGLKAFI